jgi:integrase
MEPEEFQKLLRGTDAVFRRVLVALRWSGMRPGELRSLEWDHLDFERGCIILHRHKTARTRKDRKPRVIILHPVFVKLLLWIRRHQPAGKFVFLNSRGRPWTRSAIDLRMYHLRKRVRLDPTCKLYSARHAFASQAAMNGVDLATLAELLGHTSTAMASYYVHVAGKMDHLRAAVLKAMK